MSLYGRTDSDPNKTKVASTRGNGAGSVTETIVFVDETEASLTENKSRGITGPGWWAYRTYTDGAGNTRHKANHLMVLANADLNANETQNDDAIAADVTSVIQIQTNLFNQAAVPDPYTDPAAFQITASATVGTIVYQWQRQSATGTRWTNITDNAVFAGSNGPVLSITNADKATYDGYKFRVKLTSDAGAEEVISDIGTLAFA
jgi:hypothetical protein